MDEEENIRPSSISLLSRLQIKQPPRERKKDLQTLFELPKSQSGLKKKPSRILIQGRAGIGKTTLCKKIVHDFTKHRMWCDSFDRILWVPLRKLKGRANAMDNDYSIEMLICDEFFSRAEGYRNQERRHFAHILCQELRSPKGRSLFILDGLDEVRDLNSESKAFFVLQQLLNQPHVIITSRPGAQFQGKINALDLKLETIGFYPNQVDQYLEKSTDGPTQTGEIQSFLKSHSLLRDLVRIPIQLDALCFTWEYFKHTIITRNMTGIYKAIEQRLWMKDLLRCEKTHNGVLITHSAISDLHRPDIERIMEYEIKILEILAFTGLYNDVIEFTFDHQCVISEHPDASLLSKYLPGLSFLRASDTSSISIRSYHFLHLTFQEYFAARYFVRKWKKLDLGCINLDNRHFTKFNPTRFIARYKYAAHYDVFWRFVTGLLKSEDDAADFFGDLEKQPRDLLGPTHQRLIMHCLIEASCLPESIVGRIEQDMFNWLNFELEGTHELRLPAEPDFPDQALMRVLQHERASTSKRRRILDALKKRQSISPNILELIFSWLTDTTYTSLRAEAKEILSGFAGTVPRTVLEIVAKRLKAGDSENIRLYLSLLLQPGVPLELVQSVVSIIEDRDQSAKTICTAIRAIGHSLRLFPVEILQVLTTRLEDQDKEIQSAAAYALQCRQNLPLEIIQALTPRLEDQQEWVRKEVVTILSCQSSLPLEFLQALIPRLEDQQEWVRKETADILRYQSNLPLEILQACAVQLEHQRKEIRETAALALNGQSSLPLKILKALMGQLEDQNKTIREAVTEVLRYQSILPLEILQALAAKLEDQESMARLEAARALGRQLTLPLEFLQALAVRLEDQDDSIRRDATYALSNQSNLPLESLQALAVRLEDQDYTIRLFAAKALGSQLTISDQILQGILVKCLEKGIVDEIEHVLGERDEAYSTRLTGMSFKHRYQILLNRSWKENVTWYIEDGYSYLAMPEGVSKAPLNEQFRANIQNARPPRYPVSSDIIKGEVVS
ncbi:hypothetical protein PT974_07956 [Cladobotryum mycophilum]|uniref:NACHT domain-containing protein n=1 Tax=Cladobotryum mycophilum TaxID=491253 RepID=A0ABR0SD25_9HYPO